MKLSTVKTVAGIVVTVGVGTIVEGIIKNATAGGKSGIIRKACVLVAGVVLTGIISDVAVAHVEKTIDESVSNVKKVVDELEKKPEVA